MYGIWFLKTSKKLYKSQEGPIIVWLKIRGTQNQDGGEIIDQLLGKALWCILRIHEELQETSTSQTEVCMLGKHNLLLAAKSMVLEQNLKLF